MADRVIPERLPDADEVTGMYYDPNTQMAQLQYRNKEKMYEIRFPLDQLFRSEDWFIMMRNHLGGAMKSQKDSPSR